MMLAKHTFSHKCSSSFLLCKQATKTLHLCISSFSFLSFPFILSIDFSSRWATDSIKESIRLKDNKIIPWIVDHFQGQNDVQESWCFIKNTKKTRNRYLKCDIHWPWMATDLNCFSNVNLTNFMHFYFH